MIRFGFSFYLILWHRKVSVYSPVFLVFHCFGFWTWRRKNVSVCVHHIKSFGIAKLLCVSIYLYYFPILLIDCYLSTCLQKGHFIAFVWFVHIYSWCEIYKKLHTFSLWNALYFTGRGYEIDAAVKGKTLLLLVYHVQC